MNGQANGEAGQAALQRQLLAVLGQLANLPPAADVEYNGNNLFAAVGAALGQAQPAAVAEPDRVRQLSPVPAYPANGLLGGAPMPNPGGIPPPPYPMPQERNRFGNIPELAPPPAFLRNAGRGANRGGYRSRYPGIGQGNGNPNDLGQPSSVGRALGKAPRVPLTLGSFDKICLIPAIGLDFQINARGNSDEYLATQFTFSRSKLRSIFAFCERMGLTKLCKDLYKESTPAEIMEAVCKAYEDTHRETVLVSGFSWGSVNVEGTCFIRHKPAYLVGGAELHALLKGQLFAVIFTNHREPPGQQHFREDLFQHLDMRDPSANTREELDEVLGEENLEPTPPPAEEDGGELDECWICHERILRAHWFDHYTMCNRLSTRDEENARRRRTATRANGNRHRSPATTDVASTNIPTEDEPEGSTGLGIEDPIVIDSDNDVDEGEEDGPNEAARLMQSWFDTTDDLNGVRRRKTGPARELVGPGGAGHRTRSKARSSTSALPRSLRAVTPLSESGVGKVPRMSRTSRRAMAVEEDPQSPAGESSTTAQARAERHARRASDK